MSAPDDAGDDHDDDQVVDRGDEAMDVCEASATERGVKGVVKVSVAANVSDEVEDDRADDQVVVHDVYDGGRVIPDTSVPGALSCATAVGGKGTAVPSARRGGAGRPALEPGLEELREATAAALEVPR